MITLPRITSYLTLSKNDLISAAAILAILWDDYQPIVRERHSRALALIFTIDSARTEADKDCARWALARLLAGEQ